MSIVDIVGQMKGDVRVSLKLWYSLFNFGLLRWSAVEEVIFDCLSEERGR